MHLSNLCNKKWVVPPTFLRFLYIPSPQAPMHEPLLPAPPIYKIYLHAKRLRGYPHRPTYGRAYQLFLRKLSRFFMGSSPHPLSEVSRNVLLFYFFLNYNLFQRLYLRHCPQKCAIILGLDRLVHIRLTIACKDFWAITTELDLFAVLAHSA